MPSKRKRRERAASASRVSIPLGLMDRLVQGPMTPQEVQAICLDFKKALIERAMGAELSHHLGYRPGEVRPEGQDNHRNGTTAKTVLTHDGPVRLDLPRDRDGSYEPILIPKHEEDRVSGRGGNLTRDLGTRRPVIHDRVRLGQRRTRSVMTPHQATHAPFFKPVDGYAGKARYRATSSLARRANLDCRTSRRGRRHRHRRRGGARSSPSSRWFQPSSPMGLDSRIPGSVGQQPEIPGVTACRRRSAGV